MTTRNNTSTQLPQHDKPALCQTDHGLCLTNGTMTLKADFEPLLKRTAQHKLGTEQLIRAARIKGTNRPVVFDACAGLGEDAFLLAAAGAQVFLFEHDPTIATLLRDGLARAASTKSADGRPTALVSIVRRMTLIEANSVAVFEALAHGEFSLDKHVPSKLTHNKPVQDEFANKKLAQQQETAQPRLPVHPDVIYLDPMFPAKTKHAATKKKFQLLHELEKPCENEAELLHAATVLCPKKIVIKRPVKGPFLAGEKPTYSLKGSSVRYDCIVL